MFQTVAEYTRVVFGIWLKNRDFGSVELNMKIILEKDTDLKALETKINKHLADLDAEGNNIKGITYSTDVVPVMRGEKITEYKTIFSVMIAYAPFIGV